MYKILYLFVSSRARARMCVYVCVCMGKGERGVVGGNAILETMVAKFWKGTVFEY